MFTICTAFLGNILTQKIFKRITFATSEDFVVVEERLRTKDSEEDKIFKMSLF